MYDVITFGSATRDIFVRSKNIKVIDSAEFLTGKAIAVGAGSKVYVEELAFASGGGGTNCAVTFSFQGFKTAYVGLVGNDVGGKEIIKELENLGVDASFIKITEKAKTPYSIILSAFGKERSILVFEGASHLLGLDDVPWNKIKKTKWVYIAGLSGGAAKVFEPLVEFCAKNKIKLAVNPGHDQLTGGVEILKKFLPKIDILIVNQEEASMITGVDYKREEEIFRKFDEMMPGIAIMSKGPEGVAVSDGKNIYSAGIPESGYTDRTGSGDAFGSGFVSAIMAGKDIPFAIQMATANATSTIQKIGAKNGLLKYGDFGPWPRVAVKIEKVYYKYKV